MAKPASPSPRPAGQQPPRDPRWQTRRLVRRVVAALLFGFALLALFKSGLLPQTTLNQSITGQPPTQAEVTPAPSGPLAGITAKLFPPKVDWNNDYAMIQELRRRIAADKLSTSPPNCLLFIINGNDAPDNTRVRVLQKHNKDCAGDPKTMPDLFLIKVDRSKGTVTADAARRGTFQPLD